MPTLNWNEIRIRATAFAKEWANEDSERAEAQSFWNDFFEVFGVQRRRVAVIGKKVGTTMVSPYPLRHHQNLPETIA